MEDVKCIICDSQDSKPYMIVEDRFDVNNVFKLKVCNCGFIFLNPRPTEKNISRYYKGFDYHPHNIEDVTFFSRLYNFIKRRAFQRKLKLINNFYKEPGKHIDIGGGIGDFCHYLQKNNWESINQDTSKDALQISKTRKINAINSISEIKSESIDLITAWHSIEHIHDINKVFFDIKRILKTGKYLLLCVPNSDSIDQKYYNKDWVAWDAPRHLYHFTPNLLEKYVEKFSFEIVYIESLLQDTAYNILLSSGKKNIFRYLKSFYVLFISYFTILFRGYQKSSSFLVICKKK